MGFLDDLKRLKKNLTNAGKGAVNTASKAVDQVNPLDGGRTWKQRTPTTQASARDQARKTVTNIREGGSLGLQRSGIGTAQGVSGLIDLASPGTGTNRVSKLLDQKAKGLDQTAKNRGYNSAYRVFQTVGDVAQFAGGGAAIKASTNLNKVGKITQGIAKSKPGQAMDKVNKSLDKTIAKGGKASVAATAARKTFTGTNAANMAIDAQYTLGQEASKGRDISKADVALATLPAIGLGVGLPTAAKAAKVAANTNPAKTTVKATKQVKYVTDKLDPSVRALDDQYKVLNTQWQKASGQTRKQYEQAIKANREERTRITKTNIGGSIQPRGNKTPASSQSADLPVQPQAVAADQATPRMKGSTSSENTIPELEPMLAQARKYKNADDFIEAITKGEVSVPKTDPKRMTEIQKQLGINWDDAYKTPDGVDDLQRSIAKSIYQRAKGTKSTSSADSVAPKSGLQSSIRPQELPAQATSDLADQFRQNKRLKQSMPASPKLLEQVVETEKLTQKTAPKSAVRSLQNPQTSSADNGKVLSSSSANDTTIPDFLQPQDPKFEAVAATATSKNAKKLNEAVNANEQLNRAARKAQQDGVETNYFAKTDENGRSVGIEQFDPSTHRIEAGFVVNKNGDVLGNHIKVDSTGVQVNVGGELTNITKITGNPLEWKGKYRITETMSRNIDRNAPTPEAAQATKNFLISNKFQAESKYKTEVAEQYNALNQRIKNVQASRPMGVSKSEFDDDVFSVLNGDKTDAQIVKKYGVRNSKGILEYKAQTRATYDDLLNRVNETRAKFGQQQIQPRKDYITHLQEMSNNKSFAGEVFDGLRNSFADEGMRKTRGGVPGSIAGRTENFKPVSAYNKFLQRRTGNESLRDPYKAVQEYIEPAVFNIHMTEAAARARAVEAAFRTADELRNLSADKMIAQTNKFLSEYKGNSTNAKLITGFQEYANALAKKTQRFDRQIIDASDATATGLKAWQFLQRRSGQATIVGNASSVLAQPLNQVVALADAGPVNYMKGVASAMGNTKAEDLSPFLKARFTKANAPIRGTGEKVLDAGGVPLVEVEKASIKLIWHTQYAKAKAAGLKGQKAIMQADLNTERLAAGRGIADRPELYRSTTTSGLVQFTLEVMAQNKAFWNDLSLSQKATFIAAASGVNYLYENVTGFSPLPDFLGAAIETGGDFTDESDTRSVPEKTMGGAQRVWSEIFSMNPLLSAGANTLLTQNQRKTVFGEDSDLGRFEGTPSPVKVVTNWGSAAQNAATGNLTEARNDVLRTVPFGNQARKTITGAETLGRGYAINAKGERTFDAPTDLYGQSQTLVFGPSSTGKAQEFYNKEEQPKSGGTQGGKTIKFNGKEYTMEGRQTGSEVTKTQLESYFNTPEKRAFLDLSEDEQKALAQQDGELRKWYDEIKTIKRTFKDPDMYPEGLSQESVSTLTRYDRLNENGKKKFEDKPGNMLNLKLAQYEKGLAEGKFTDEQKVAEERKLLKFQLAADNKIKGTDIDEFFKAPKGKFLLADKEYEYRKEFDPEYTALDEFKDLNELVRLDVQKDFSKDAVDLYSLSEKNIFKFLEGKQIDPKLWEELVALDAKMIEAGLLKYSKLDGGSSSGGRRSGGGRGRRSGGGRSSSGSTFSMPTQDLVSGARNSTNNRLRSLLAGTTIKRR